jgi:hypothetical protein
MDIRKILNKKKLRGEEVGRALLAETIYSYKKAQKGKDTDGIFTPAERSKMVEGLLYISVCSPVACLGGSLAG